VAQISLLLGKLELAGTRIWLMRQGYVVLRRAAQVFLGILIISGLVKKGVKTEDRNYEKVGKILEPHRMAVVQGAIQINKRIIKNGLTWEDVESWIKENSKLTISESEATRLKVKAIPRLCSKCGKPMNGSNLYPESEKYKEGLRSYWICGASCCKDKGCGYEEFSKKTVEETLRGE